MKTTDLVVVIPGITGSELAYRGTPIWTTAPRSLVTSILRFSKNADRLLLPDDIGDGVPDDGIVATRLIDSLHIIPGVWSPICGYDALLNHLRARGFSDSNNTPNLLPFPYDWRLSNRYNASLLKLAVESALDRWRASAPERADAKVVLACHSMGGLIARWYVSLLGGNEIVSKVITLGTPHRGSPKAITALTMGPPAPFKKYAAILRDVASPMPSLHQLLPSYACVETGGSTNYLGGQAIPGLSAQAIRDAATFYASLEQAEAAIDQSPTMYPIIGIDQPTAAAISLGPEGITVSDALGGIEFGGDGTVPVASIPKGMSLDDNRLKRIGDKHGHLQANAAVLDEVLGVITSTSVRFKAPVSQHISVASSEIVSSGEPLIVSVKTDRIPSVLIATVLDENARVHRRTQHNVRTTECSLKLDPLGPGGYTLIISPAGQPPERTGVASPLLVWPSNE